jgi:hypothetical protein
MLVGRNILGAGWLKDIRKTRSHSEVLFHPTLKDFGAMVFKVTLYIVFDIVLHGLVRFLLNLHVVHNEQAVSVDLPAPWCKFKPQPVMHDFENMLPHRIKPISHSQLEILLDNERVLIYQCR